MLEQGHMQRISEKLRLERRPELKWSPQAMEKLRVRHEIVFHHLGMAPWQDFAFCFHNLLGWSECRPTIIRSTLGISLALSVAFVLISLWALFGETFTFNVFT